MKKNQSSTTYVCMTGFSIDSDAQDYEKYLKQLNCTFLNKMSYSTHILIVNSVATEKYKMAKLTKLKDGSKINCVTINWLLDSYKAKKLLDLDQYQIPTIFYGTSIGIMGFSNEQNKTLTKLLKDNGAQVTIVKKEDFENGLQINIILSTQENFQRLEQFREKIQIPIVSIKWLEDSLKRKMCKFPRDYAMNYQNLHKQSNAINLKKLQESVKTMSTNFLLLDTYEDIFVDVILYIDGSVESVIANTLKNAVCAYGGIYLNEISPLVTHVLVQKITQEQHENYLKYGNLLQVVRAVWFTDSIYMKSKLLEEDYQITQFLPSLPNFKKQNFNSNMFIPFQDDFRNSISFASLPIGQLKRTKSISISGNGNTKQIKGQQRIVIKKKCASGLFQNKFFYAEESQKKSPQLFQLSHRIKQHGGSFIQQLKRWKRQVYYILIDSPNNNNIIKNEGKSKDIIFVSKRWVDQCIKSGQFLDPKTTETFLFRPYHTNTPQSKFMQYKFQIVGQDEKQKMTTSKKYKQLLSLLGSKNNTINKSQVTHMLWVGKSQDKQKAIQQFVKGCKYKEVVELKKVDKIPIIDKEWLEKIYEIGTTVEYEPYILN